MRCNNRCLTLVAALLAATLLSPGRAALAQTPGSAAPGPGSAPGTAPAPPPMASDIPSAAAPPPNPRLLDLRRLTEDERQVVSQLAAIVQNRVALQQILRDARLSGIPLDDIPLPNTAKDIATTADAQARQQADAIARAREQAAKEQAARDAQAGALDAPGPAQGGQSAGQPAAAPRAAPSTARTAAAPIDPRPRWTEIVGVAPHFYAMIATNGQVHPAGVGDPLANGWTITAIGPKSVTAIDRARQVHTLPHLSAVD
ncbi:hypothetical protein [Azospirillum canadense]|uniref:hypothetical protein n=1 Tax=Azospirillum canadense TaxID=403962 RepID=UPI0022274101|nr:hypothetical protein [Azospirillum canadense]MCW2240356.1 type IV pilus biogenesis protein PilP [Azospirillum canadense]